MGSLESLPHPATPYKAVKVNIPYAYRHFYQNTNNTNRNYIKGAFFDVLQKPLFVAEQKTDKGNSVYFTRYIATKMIR